MGVEIEKKFLVKALPEDLERFPYHEITQGYLCRHPAVRVRRERDYAGASAAEERYYLTYKGLRRSGALAQEEYNLDLTPEAYAHLIAKADGTVLEKRRYLLPLNADAFTEQEVAESAALRTWLSADAANGAWIFTKEGVPKIELDIFSGIYDGLIVAEVEFPSEEIAARYHPAGWFGEEVTDDERYSNAWMAEHAGSRGE